MKLQAIIGMGRKSFLPHIRRKFGFEEYRARPHKRVPLFVFGCGSHMLKSVVMNHKGIVVILWTGSDTLALQEGPAFLEYLLSNRERVFHLTFSHWCKTDLDHFGIPYQHRLIIPIEMGGFQFEPKTEEEIYHYGNAKRTWYYGTDLVEEIDRKWDTYQEIPHPDFIYTTYNSHSPTALHGLYKDSILGVRLTEHDGIAGSVLEMGLMGRRSIYNDPQIPCAIPYMENPYVKYNPGVRNKWCYQDNSLVEIVGDIIQKELQERPVPDKLLAEEMKEFVHDDLAWLDTKFYTG